MHSDPLSRIALLLIFITATLPLSLSTPAQADTQLTYTDSGIGENTRTTLIQIKGHKVRMGEINHPVYSLFDHQQQTLFTVNAQTRQYIDSGVEKTLQRTQKAAAMQKNRQTQLLAQLPNMPLQQRQAVQAGMQQMQAILSAPAPEIKQQPDNKTLQIQGIACQITTYIYNGIPGRSVCNASPETIDKADFQTLLNMFAFMDTITTQSAKIHGFTAAPEPTANLHKAGLALQIQALPAGPRSELSAISTTELDAQLFLLPPGYREFEPTAMANPPAGQAPRQ